MAYARKRVYRKRRMPMRMRRKVPYKAGIKKKVAITRSANLTKDVHYFSRYVVAVDTTTLSTITSEIGAALTFRLSDIPNVSEYTNLFENFRIIGVKLTFRLMTNPDSSSFLNNSLVSQGSNYYPKLWWQRDYDDNVVLTVAQIRERASSKCAILKPDKFITIFIKYPKPLLEMAGNTSTGALAAPKGLWLRTNSTNEIDAPHLGLKVVMDKMGYAGNTFTIGIDKQYFFAFKNSK